MSSGIYDNPDDWFKGSYQKTPKTKGGAGGKKKVKIGFGKPKGKGGNFTASAKAVKNERANNTKKPSTAKNSGRKANTSSKKAPSQVMVKISGSSKGGDKAQAHLNYIGRKGEVEIEDEAGNVYKGDSQKSLIKTWQAMGLPEKDEQGTRKEVLNIVFSMPNNTDADKMKMAVKEVLKEEFDGHKYYIAQHLDTKNPHCHVVLSASDERGAYLNPRKQDLHNYRVAFVEKLAEQGIEASATRKAHRYNYRDSKRQGVYHRDKRNGVGESVPTSQQWANIKKSHAKIDKGYKELAKSKNLSAEDKKKINDIFKGQSLER